MTAQEKQALLQFMGVTYGAAVKMDRDIVSSSNQLTPISDSIKHQFERIMPVAVDDRPHSPPTPEPYTPSGPTVPLGAAYPPELQPVTEPFITPELTYKGTVAHDPTLIDTLISIRMALTRIGDILELKQANDKPAKKSKAQQT
jgi:hypothetical protein